nr:MAG TPA: hypothetical protein [Bacteriophage sp.]
MPFKASVWSLDLKRYKFMDFKLEELRERLNSLIMKNKRA